MPKPQPNHISDLTTEPISRGQFEFLSQERHQPCVSIFLPSYRTAPESKQVPIRLKNLTRQAEAELTAMGLRPVKIREFLAPARELIEREDFWMGADGLAIFLSSNFFQYFRLPLRFEELVTVTDRFELSPLLPLFTAGGRFYVLALSRNQVRLVEGTPYASSELALPNIARSEAELLRYDVRDSVLQVHSGASGQMRGKKADVFTGQGVGVDDEETRTLEFVYAVERGIRRLLRDQESLVLAAVEELQAVYRKVNRYRGLLPRGLVGNPDLLRPDELRQAAWKVAGAHFEENERQALQTYVEGKGSAKSSRDLREILFAAHQGRVLSAFIEAGAHRWGDYDFEADLLQLRESRQPGDEDLLNLAAIQTIVHRGTAYQLPAQQMPDGAFLAACFRY